MGQPSTPHESSPPDPSGKWRCSPRDFTITQGLCSHCWGRGAGQQVHTGLGTRWAVVTLAIPLPLSTPQPPMQSRQNIERKLMDILGALAVEGRTAWSQKPETVQLRRAELRRASK